MNTISGQIAEANRSRTFTYDAIERLTKVSEPGAGGTAVDTESYTLDAEGNRTASQDSNIGLTDAANRLTENETHVFEYDVDNNLVKKTEKATGVVWDYTYDNYDRLTQAARSEPGTFTQRVSYTYDAFARRISRRVGRLTETLIDDHFVHDGWTIASTDELRASVLTRRYWITQTDAIDDPVALTEWDGGAAGGGTGAPATASHYYSTDHLGTVRALHAGHVAWGSVNAAQAPKRREKDQGDGKDNTVEHACPCCGGSMRIIEVFKAGCTPLNKPTPEAIDSS